MLSISDVATVARGELAGTFRERKGWLLALAVFLLGAVPSLLRLLGQHSAQAAELHRAHAAALVKIYERDIARALLDCPPVLVVIALATFFFQPLVVLFAGSDRLAAEIDSGSIRFSTVRAPRTAIVIGKMLGLWAVVSLLTIGVQAAITVVAVYDQPRDWAWTLRWATAIMLYSAASALVYASLCTFLGVVLARPRLVFLVGLGVIFALRIARTVLRERDATALASMVPGALDQLFLTAGVASKLAAVAVVAGWTLALMTGAALAFQRRSV